MICLDGYFRHLMIGGSLLYVVALMLLSYVLFHIYLHAGIANI